MLIIVVITIAALGGFAIGFRAASQRTRALVEQAQFNTLQLIGSPEFHQTLDLIVKEFEKERHATDTEV
jgi:hypothetical protein